MAHAQRLAEQVKRLTERVHELETALGHTPSDGEASSSQLEGSDNVASYQEGLQDVSDAIGSLSIGVFGQTKYHGESAGSEVSAWRCSPRPFVLTEF